MLKNTTICCQDHDLITVSEGSTRIHDSKNQKQLSSDVPFAIGTF